jgi:hypothetical protein
MRESDQPFGAVIAAGQSAAAPYYMPEYMAVHNMQAPFRLPERPSLYAGDYKGQTGRTAASARTR